MVETAASSTTSATPAGSSARSGARGRSGSRGAGRCCAAARRTGRRLAAVADELRRAVEPGLAVRRSRTTTSASALDPVGARRRRGSPRQRRGLVEERPARADDPLAADLVEAASALGAAILRDGVGAVERVVEAAPAGVGGVERVAGVRDRHDELRPGDAGDLVVHVLRSDRERLRLRQEIADLAQEALVRRRVEGLARRARGDRRRSAPAGRRGGRAARGCGARSRTSAASPSRTRRRRLRCRAAPRPR